MEGVHRIRPRDRRRDVEQADGVAAPRQQDHDRLEEAWFDLAPHVMAIAARRGTYDIDVLRDGVPALAALYLDHIELEEAFIHPHARGRMPVPARR